MKQLVWLRTPPGLWPFLFTVTVALSVTARSVPVTTLSDTALLQSQMPYSEFLEVNMVFGFIYFIF